MSAKKQSGGCQCGAVRFETTETPVRALACHCVTCKRRTGSAYGIGVYFNESEVTFVSGSEALGTFEFHSDTTRRWLRNVFCKQCGTAVSWTLEMRPGLVAVAGGAYDNPDWFKINAHLWARSARSDMCFPDDIPVYQEAIPTA